MGKKTQLTRAESRTLVQLLYSDTPLALEILISDVTVHPSCTYELYRMYRQRYWTNPVDSDAWQQIRVRYWRPSWQEPQLVEVGKNTFNMNNLIATKGTIPCKGVVLVKLPDDTFKMGRYCPENDKWLVDGHFEKPKRITWYREQVARHR